MCHGQIYTVFLLSLFGTLGFSGRYVVNVARRE